MCLREIEGYPGYMASDDGRIWNVARQKWLKPEIDKYGYCQVCLSIGGKQKHPTVHKLVALAFISNPNGLNQINHKNEIKTDNRVSNLEWCTNKYNCNYGTQRQKLRDAKHHSKTPVIQYKNGTEVARYESIVEASRKCGLRHRSISMACQKHKTYAGYEWRFEEEVNNGEFGTEKEAI